MGRCVIIYNPIAGRGAGERAAESAQRALSDAGWEVDCIATRDRSGATGISQSLADDVTLLVVAGGDGTLREAIEGLGERASRVTLGFVPLGNANVAARELGIPLDIEGAVRLLCEGSSSRVDLGWFSASDVSGLFLAMIGIGWDAITTSYIDRLRHTRLGGLCYRLWADGLYLLCGLAAAFRRTRLRLRIAVDGRELPEPFCAVHFCNFRTYAKGMAMAPEAHPQSGRLHYQARRRGSLLALIRHLLAAQLGRPAPDSVSRYGNGLSLRATGSEPFPVQIDGDYRGTFSELRVEIRPAAISIIVPRTEA
jgi:YegS/Rv2252/BmrU family lipid kinase